MKASYNVTNAYLSIPIDKASDLILQQLSDDYDDLKTRTSLTPIDFQQLIGLCVSKCYFLSDNAIWNLINSEPIDF